MDPQATSPVPADRKADAVGIATGGRTDDDDAPEPVPVVFSLRIRHPDIDPNRLTEALGRQPFRCWRAGEKRAAPNGAPLPGNHADSYWVAQRRAEGPRDASAAIAMELAALEAAASVLETLTAGGGRVTLKLGLPGTANVAALLPWDMLQRLAKLRVDLDVEVFPQGV